MEAFSFRQWVACVAMVAVIFSTAAPLGVCLCEGCNCKNNISRLLTHSAVAEKKCCCTSPEPMPEDGCCGSSGVPCSCTCDGTKNDVAFVPATVLPAKQSKVSPFLNVVSAISVVSSDALRGSPIWGSHRAIPPPHVPLHVLLCVFLN